jgi:hypothetical protein
MITPYILQATNCACCYVRTSHEPLLHPGALAPQMLPRCWVLSRTLTLYQQELPHALPGATLYHPPSPSDS